MPYKDPEKRRAYQRDRDRRDREQGKTNRKTRRNQQQFLAQCADPVQAAIRVRSSLEAIALLEKEIAKVQEAKRLGVIARARCIGYLVNTCLRAIETGGLEAQIQALLDRVAALERGLAA